MRQARVFAGVAALAAAVLFAADAAAQDVKSAAGATELAKVLAGKKLDAIAAKDPSAPDAFVAALHFPGQLMVISARYAAPPLLNEKLVNRDYRDVYIELNAASIVESRIFVTDVNADGLRPRREGRDGPVDMRDAGGTTMRFDGNWREDKMSEDEYMKAFAAADAHYAQAVDLLLAEAKK
ncbi:MAG: hypothetical protein AB7U83_02585 [Vicinamibacterales bacterium]